MPLLGTLMMNLVVFLTGIFGRFFVLEKAFKLAAVASMVLLATALYAALNSCVTGICGQAITNISSGHKYFGMGLGIVFNSVTYTAASCYISVWTLCQMYVLKKRMFSLMV